MPATRVAANYAGNDEAAKKFTDETGIKTYKWSVADYDACAAGIKQVEADLGPVEVAGQQRRHHPRRAVPQDDAAAVARGHRHQPHRRLQHDASGLARHARAQVRPGRHHLLDQRPEGPVRPGQLLRVEGRRHRLRQGAGAGGRARRASPSTRLPRLHRHRDGDGGAARRCCDERSSRRSRSAASASRKRSRAASCSSPRTTPASSPARPSRPTAGSSSSDGCKNREGPRTGGCAAPSRFRLLGGGEMAVVDALAHLLDRSCVEAGRLPRDREAVTMPSSATTSESCQFAPAFFESVSTEP